MMHREMISYHDIMPWWHHVISWHDTMVWYHMMILCYDSMIWYHDLISNHNILSWCQVMISFHDLISWHHIMISGLPAATTIGSGKMNENRFWNFTIMKLHYFWIYSSKSNKNHTTRIAVKFRFQNSAWNIILISNH